MNEYINAQILNMKIIVKTFQQSCKVGAYKNDEKIDPKEAKVLRKIDKAAEKFIVQLERIKP